MIRKIAKALILVPLAILIIGFAVANRQMITVSFDPFDSTQPSYSASMPLFVLIFVLVIVGVIVGGVATWFSQAKWRRTARVLEDENRKLNAELYDLQRRCLAAEQVETPAIPPAALLRPPID
jgi:uncharacterized integral membrane protein